jgi:hypothetical protein
LNLQVIYDRETGSLLITLRDASIRESDEVRAGVIADFGEDGGVVRLTFEVLRASRVVEDAERVQFATTG